MHADYSHFWSQFGSPIRISIFKNRIEIENPGILPFGLTIDDVKRGVSKIRNRVIARVFKELNLVEIWGSGVQRMISECEQHGLPAPILRR